MILNDLLNSNHQRSTWFYANKIPIKYINKTLVKLPRPWWMTSLDKLNWSDINSFDCISPVAHDSLLNIEEPLYVAILESADQPIIELHRGFVLPNK